MTNKEFKTLAGQCRALFEAGIDTKDMSQAAQVIEAECKRALHHALEARRHVLGSLKASAR